MQAQTSIVVTLYYTVCLLPVKQHLHIVCIIIICCQCFTVMIYTLQLALCGGGNDIDIYMYLVDNRIYKLK